MVRFTIVIIAGFFLFSCAGISAYQHWSIKPDSISGEMKADLLGDKPENDSTLEALCLDKENHKIKCFVLLTSVYGQMLKDLDDCKVRLDACERAKE